MADEEPRRYQTRARAKVVDEHVSTKSVPLRPPGPARALRNTTAAKSVEITLKAKSNTTTIPTAAAAVLRPTRKVVAGKKETTEKAPRFTGIPVPVRARSARSAKATATNPPKLNADESEAKEQNSPRRRAAAGGGRGGKKKSFNEDKENQGPASEMEAELKQQELAGAESQPSNPLTVQPIRKMASGSMASPTKNIIRPIASLKPAKDPEALLSSPPKRLNQPPCISPDSADELDCPVSVGLQPQARRSNNPVRLQPPEQVNLLASPPRRMAPQQPKADRQLPAMVLTFDQPAMLMQSPAKRGSALSHQSPARGATGKQLAMPLKMDLLTSPPKRPAKKPVNEADVEKEVDELSLDTYKIENSPRRPMLKKRLGFVPLVQETKKREEEDIFMSKKEWTPVPGSVKTDAEGDVEMVDVDTDMEDALASPCPAGHPKSQNFGLFSEDDGWDVSPTAERAVTPLVTGLEDLSMGLEGSRKSLFPKGKERSIALEDSAQLDIRDGNEENVVMGGMGIPIDPMLLEEDFTERRSPSKVPVGFGDHKRSRHFKSNVLAGAVVYVDVSNADGSTFVEMLQRMGAKTVKQWAWNPAADNGGAGKIGITHVVFKGGRSETLQKIKKSKGVVVCVGVRWVMECAKQQTWIDEGLFSVDLDNGARRGHSRRTSAIEREVPAQGHSSQSLSSSRQFQVAVDGGPNSVQQGVGGEFFRHASSAAPQVNRLGFYVGGGNTGQPVGLMEKLMLVRRKSLKYAPKVGSPLGKNCQWADY
ncbi:hypothetical protein BGX38DRAFT_1141761 [Terfezia claveryi]|nr:hypothetical protein BGX38DRAFT_1141761 [Terfezia claveryi]